MHRNPEAEAGVEAGYQERVVRCEKVKVSLAETTSQRNYVKDGSARRRGRWPE